MDELKIRQIVKEELSILVKGDRFTFEKLRRRRVAYH